VAAAQEIQIAIVAIEELVTLSPERGTELIRREASLAPIRGEVNDLLESLAISAKSYAVQTLAAASLVLQKSGLRRWPFSLSLVNFRAHSVSPLDFRFAKYFFLQHYAAFPGRATPRRANDPPARGAFWSAISPAHEPARG
jgi:hypothetical protein